MLAPLIGIGWVAVRAGGDMWHKTLADPDATHAYLLTAVITVITVARDGVLGRGRRLSSSRTTTVAKGIVSAIVDLPFAVSPMIVGLMAVLLFGRGGWFEPWFSATGSRFSTRSRRW